MPGVTQTHTEDDPCYKRPAITVQVASGTQPVFILQNIRLLKANAEDGPGN